MGDELGGDPLIDPGESAAKAEEPSRRRVTGWALLAAFGPVGLWLLWEIQRTEGIGSTRLWDLLREDRVFDFAMLDFFGTAAWAAVVLLERADPKSVRTWLALAVFCAVPTLGIILFLLLGRTRPGGLFAKARGSVD